MLRLCGFSNEAFAYNEIIKKFNLTTEENLDSWLHLAVVREPFDRFISGFVDKCVIEKTWKKFKYRCNGCKEDIACFIKREHARMMSYANGEAINSFDDRHFFPQNWYYLIYIKIFHRRCEFFSQFRHFKIIHYSPDTNGTNLFFYQLFNLLKRQPNVTKDAIEFIQEQVFNGRTKHSTFATPEREFYEQKLRADSTLTKLIIQMYYYDYVLFGFPIMNIL